LEPRVKEFRILKVRGVEIRGVELCFVQFHAGQIGGFEFWSLGLILNAPAVQCVDSLLKDLDVLLIGHIGTYDTAVSNLNSLATTAWLAEAGRFQ
jgi:hypothetical protein